VMHIIATMLTQAITLMALVLFFALKYLQAKRKFMLGLLLFIPALTRVDLFE